MEEIPTDEQIDDVQEEYFEERHTEVIDTVSYVIPFGDEMNAHTGSKNNIARVLAHFTRLAVPSSYVMIGKHAILMEVPKTPGDADWFVSKVERKVDMIGTRSDDDARGRAERMVEVYNSLEDSDGKYGFKVMEHYMIQYTMKFDRMER